MTMIDPAIVPQRTLYTGAKMPAVGMGTFGSDHADADAVSASVAGALRVGYRSFDCAACYGNEDTGNQGWRCCIKSLRTWYARCFVYCKIKNALRYLLYASLL